MKRITMLLLAAGSVCVLSSANAQSNSKVNRGETVVGVKAGVSIASLSSFSGRDRISGHGGVFIHHSFNKNFCIQPELLFSGEGQRYYSNAVEHTLVLNYLQVPIMMQYYPVPNFYVEAGPQAGILISAQDRVGGRNGHSNVKADFSGAQLALGIGAGVKATEQIIIYGRYNFGLTDVSVFDNIVDHSRVGQIGIAIRFNH
jgi:hypothetical protein